MSLHDAARVRTFSFDSYCVCFVVAHQPTKWFRFEIASHLISLCAPWSYLREYSETFLKNIECFWCHGPLEEVVVELLVCSLSSSWEAPAAHHSEFPMPVTSILFGFDSGTKYDIGVKPMAFGRGRVWGMGYCWPMGFFRKNHCPPSWWTEKCMGYRRLWVIKSMGYGRFDCNKLVFGWACITVLSNQKRSRTYDISNYT